MKIRNFVCYNLRNNEHFQFMTEFRNFVTKETAEKLKIATPFSKFASLYAREDEALQRINRSPLTEKIHQASIARDEVFTATVDLVKMMCKHFNPVIRDAALRMKIVFDTYGNIARKSLNEQTSAIYNLLQELNLPKYTDDRINTQVNPFLNELKNRNERLEALMQQRFEESGNKSDIVLRDARKETDGQYKFIVEYLNSHLFIMEADNPAGLADFEHFVKTFNAVIDKYTAIIHARAHHKHKRAAEAEETDEGE